MNINQDLRKCPKCNTAPEFSRKKKTAIWPESIKRTCNCGVDGEMHYFKYTMAEAVLDWQKGGK